MAVNYTTLLGLAQPVTGTEAGTWGDVVNDYLTTYLEAAVAGTQTISGTQTAVTLSVTTGGTPLVQAAATTAGSAQYQIINCTGTPTPAGTLVITAPNTSRVYLVINATTNNQSVTVKASATTGVTIPALTRALIAWSGSDYILIASNRITDLTGTLATGNGGTGLTTFTAANNAIYSTSSSALTAGTLPVEAGGTGAATLTANNVLLGNGTSAVQVVAPGTSGNGLTSNGTTWVSNPLNSAKNKIINGAMDIAQRGTTFSGLSASPASATYTLDRFRIAGTSTTAVVTVSQQADVPSDNEFQFSLRFAVTTADTSIGSGDLSILDQVIEGYNVRDLIGRTFTLSFWVRSSKTGTHCIGFRNGGLNRSYIAEYTVSAANTWEKKSITVSGGLITAGTWDWTNGQGLQVAWTLAAGSNFQTTAGAWQTGNFLATANQVNCLDSNTNTFAITGVQLELGAVATPFEHRLFGDEYALCQRYYETGSFSLYAYGAASESFGGSFYFKTTKRSTPTIATSSVSNTNNSGLTVADVSVDKGAGYATGTATARQALLFNWIASIEL